MDSCRRSGTSVTITNYAKLLLWKAAGNKIIPLRAPSKLEARHGERKMKNWNILPASKRN